MSRPPLCLSVLAALLCAVPASSQQTAPAAEAVVRQAFAAMEARRWHDVAALVHPEALRRSRAHEIESARWRDDARFRPHRDPAMPEAVARWFEEQARKHAESSRSHLEWQYGVRSRAELEALSAEEMMARRLRSQDPEEILRRQLRERGREAVLDSMPERPTLLRRTVVGAVMEDDSTAHVVYNLTAPGDTGMHVLDRIALVTVRRSPAGWRL